MNLPRAGREGGLKLDPLLIGIVLSILLFGLVMVTSASISIAAHGGGDPFSYLRSQLVLALGGALLAALLCAVPTSLLQKFATPLLGLAALSVFVALFQALSDRRRELALMRLLGASPRRLFGLLVGEGLLLTAIGVVLGLAIGHGVLAGAGRWFSPRGELPLTGLDFDTMEWLYAGGALLLGCLAATIPAWLAARTPLAGALSDD